MKRFFLFLSVVMALLPLHAAVYFSNPVGQKLEEKEAFEGVFFELVSDGGTTEFFEDGRLVRRRSEEGGTVTTEEDGVTTVTYYDESRRPVRDLVYTENSTIEIQYEYSEDGILSQTLTIENGEITSLTLYNFSTLTLLSSVSNDGERNYFSSTSYTFVEDGRVVVVDNYPNYQFRRGEEEVSYDADGNLTVKSGGKETLYRPDGQVVRQIEKNDEGAVILTIDYEYDEDAEIARIVTKRGEESEVVIYEEGREKITEFYKGEILVTTRSRSTDGTIREVEMRGGKPFAAITYDIDGLRVLSLEIL